MTQNNEEDNEIKLSQIIIEDKNIVTRPFSSTTVSGLQSSIAALNNFSAGLSVSMNESTFSKSFASVLDGQKEALNLVNKATARLADHIPDVLTAVESVSGALTNIGLVANNTAKLFGSGLVDENYLSLANKISDTVLSIVDSQQGVLSSAIGKITIDTPSFEYFNTFAPSTHIISSGVDHMMRAMPTYPTGIDLDSFLDLEVSSEDEGPDLPEYQEKLDLILGKINPELVEYRKGAWDTFEEKGRDYIGQSSSSMRRMVDDLLRTLAPDNKVKDTKFYNTEEGNKDGKPTRRARLRYIVRIEEKSQEHLKRLVHSIDSFLQVYDNLSAWDHKPLKENEFVYGAFIAIEGLLVSLLSEVYS